MFALAGQTYAQDTNAVVERLHRAAVLNSIDDAAMKPWHLKLSFQLFDDKGKPTEKGTIEEWWADPSSHKTVYTSPSYSNTDIQTKDGFYRKESLSPVPHLLQLILLDLIHPMPSEREIAEAKPDLQEHEFGKTKMDCIMLAQAIKNLPHSPLGLFPTYCFDHDQDSLRVSFDFGSQTITRNRLGMFQDREVGVDQTLSSGSINAITAHLDNLEVLPVVESDMIPPAEFKKINPKLIMVSSGVAQGLRIKSVPPIYPENSRNSRIAGAVILRGLIGSDGRIHSLKVISTPDPDLAIAAITAVRQWTYKPYLLNGAAVDMDTQITVNFAFGN
jgi:TonB family protein